MFNCESCKKKLEFSGDHWYCPHCNKCTCGQNGWDPKCNIPLHKQIYDRPIGMTD